MLFMTPNVVKNFLSKKATRMYPFEVREPFEGFRGELVNDIDGCIFCGMCSKKCPSQCNTVDRAAGTWECDPYACIYCSVCVDNCPTKCLSMANMHRKPAAGKEMYALQGTPPKPKKKAAAKADAPAEAKAESKAPAKKKAAKKDEE
jgi:ech hydrogenase subunit F